VQIVLYPDVRKSMYDCIIMAEVAAHGGSTQPGAARLDQSEVAREAAVKVLLCYLLRMHTKPPALAVERPPGYVDPPTRIAVLLVRRKRLPNLSHPPTRTVPRGGLWPVLLMCNP
jgi:hypothetical protein